MISTTTGSWIRSRLRPVFVEITLKFASYMAKVTRVSTLSMRHSIVTVSPGWKCYCCSLQNEVCYIMQVGCRLMFWNFQNATLLNEFHSLGSKFCHVLHFFGIKSNNKHNMTHLISHSESYATLHIASLSWNFYEIDSSVCWLSYDAWITAFITFEGPSKLHSAEGTHNLLYRTRFEGPSLESTQARFEAPQRLSSLKLEGALYRNGCTSPSQT